MNQITLTYPEPEKSRTVFVSLPLDECVELLRYELTRNSKLIDRWVLSAPDGKNAVVCVYERYFFRVGNYLTLTVTADNFTGRTRVRCIAAGGGSSVLVNFDRGATDAFESAARDVLRPYFCKETEERSEETT